MWKIIAPLIFIGILATPVKGKPVLNHLGEALTKSIADDFKKTKGS